MTPSTFTTIFLAAVALTLAVELWLELRQVAHVRRHRDAVPLRLARILEQARPWPRHATVRGL